MRIINALSLAPDVLNWLALSQHPRILHVFDHACNLLNERREVLSIVTPQIGNGPFNLVVEDAVLFSDSLNAKSQISIHTDQLRLGDLTINTADANLWSSRPDWDLLHTRRADIIDQLVKLSITNYREAPHSHWGQLSSVLFFNSLASSLVSADLPSSLTAAKQLAGLGVGLTPTGDDFILGALLAVWIIHPPEIASVLAEEITNIAAPLTTSLSAVWLRSAGRGEAGILWHKFFDTLIFTDSEQIQTATDNILAIGETSGADALAGFVSVFISYAELETRLCHS
jgi:hypothetical protein